MHRSARMNLQHVLDLPSDAANRICRFEPFGPAHREQMIREILGLANAEVNDMRYILFGAHHDGTALNIIGMTDTDIACLSSDVAALSEFIEPDLTVNVNCESVDGKTIAVLRLEDCGNPPYVVKHTVSDRLQRGECWIRRDGKAGLASRDDLDRMYGRIQPVESPSILIGFNGQVSEQVLEVSVPDRSSPPSKRESEKPALQIEANTATSETSIARARVVNARMHAAESAITEADNTIRFNMAAEELRKRADIYYFFEEQAVKVNFAILNKTRLAFENATFELTFPRTSDFDISDQLYTEPTKKISSMEGDLMGYPEVEKNRTSIRVYASLGAVQPERQIDAFQSAVRMAVGEGWRGKKLGIQYSLAAENLKKPFTGRLKIRFTR
jgi:hypothetical protein